MSEGLWDYRPDHDDEEVVTTPTERALARCTHLAALLLDLPVCDMCNAVLTPQETA